MNLFRISWRNLVAKPFATFLSLLLLTLGVATISILLLLDRQLEDQFKKNLQGVDMVLGAKGSPMQLILSAVYHIDDPTGNISLKEAEPWMNHSMVERAIPMSYGDNYQNFRILGTTPDLLQQYGDPQPAEGRVWENALEVCLGAYVAQTTGLKVGDAFHGSHGLEGSVTQHEHMDYKVVGILPPNGSVLDRLILTPLESVWNVHGHGNDSSKAERQITAVLVKFKGPMAMFKIPRAVNENSAMQAALPAVEVNRMFDLLGVGFETIRAFAIALMIISGLSVFISLYNSLRERRYEMALLRSMGARPYQLFLLVIQEGLLLSLGGYLLGLLLSRGAFGFLASALEDQFRFTLPDLSLLPTEGWLLIPVVIIGILAGLLPGVMAYRTDISLVLSEN